MEGSLFTAGELDISGANVDGSIVRGGVSATVGGGQCALFIVIGAEDGTVPLNIGRDKASFDMT